GALAAGALAVRFPRDVVPGAALPRRAGQAAGPVARQPHRQPHRRAPGTRALVGAAGADRRRAHVQRPPARRRPRRHGVEPHRGSVAAGGQRLLHRGSSHACAGAGPRPGRLRPLPRRRPVGEARLVPGSGRQDRLGGHRRRRL
ncbi:MAG: hypothetical protein AVDCRST_MAG52-435, partial [uncultured Blastococcus sp.]